MREHDKLSEQALREEETWLPMDTAEERASDNDTEEEAFQAIIAEDLPAQLLESLSNRQREVLWLRYHEGLTLKKVGERMGVSFQRVSEMEQQARSTLLLQWDFKQLKLFLE